MHNEYIMENLRDLIFQSAANVPEFSSLAENRGPSYLREDYANEILSTND